MPKYFVGFFAAVMFGAVLSTYNSVLNSASTLFCLNVYKPVFGKNKTDAEIVSKGKVFGSIIALISMLIAPMIMNAPQGLFQYLQIVNGFFNVPIFTIIFIGYMTKYVPAIAAKVSLVFFVSSYAVLQLIIKPELHFLHQLTILFIISCGIMLVIGKIKPRETPYVLVNKNVVEITPWEYQYEAGVIIIAVMLSFYVIFSKLGLASLNFQGLQKGLGLLWTITALLVISIRKYRQKSKIEKRAEA